MAASIIMNQMIVGGTGSSGGGAISLLHGATLPDAITPRAIFAVTEEAISGMVIQGDEPGHAVGLIWIEIASIGEPEVIGSDGEEAVELISAWISTGTDWAPLEAYHSATGAWVRFSVAALPTPEYTYTGSHELIDDGDGNWRIKFLTSGILQLINDQPVDVFLVGGGGGATYNGGGGGYTKTFSSVMAQKNVSIPIIIGAGGLGEQYNGETLLRNATNGGYTEFNEGQYRANGGQTPAVYVGGVGASGGGTYGGSSSSAAGNGGSDGGNGGSSPSYTGGAGQGTTTREFEESAGDLYAGGGGGGNTAVASTSGYGGDGGGGDGNRSLANGRGGDGEANTGGGGGGNSGSKSSGVTRIAGDGGSGIVIIRNAREVA